MVNIVKKHTKMSIIRRKRDKMPNNPDNLNIITWVWVIAVSILGGTVRTLSSIKTGMTVIDFMRRWTIDIIVSAFIGVITFFLCSSADFNPMLTAALVGISAHMGTRAIVLLEEVLYCRMMKAIDKDIDCEKIRDERV